MQQRRSRNLLAISLVSLVALAACGDDETTESTSAAVETTAAVTEMARALHRRGVLTKLRQSAAQDVEGGCGQLRARSLSPAPIRWVAKRSSAQHSVVQA